MKILQEQNDRQKNGIQGLFFVLHYIECQRHELKNDSKTECNEYQIVLSVGAHQEPHSHEQTEQNHDLHYSRQQSHDRKLAEHFRPLHTLELSEDAAEKLLGFVRGNLWF